MDGGSANGECDRLVRGCLAGDEACQQELIDRYAGLCYSIASRILGPQGRSYVEDAVQESFYAVFARLAQWRGANLSAWIGTIAARRAIDVRRAVRRRGVEKTGLEAGLLADSPDPDAQRRQLDFRQALAAARGGLTRRQQELLDELLAGRSRAQMAQKLGISVRTVHYELSEVRRRLRDSLETLADRGGAGRLYSEETNP